jgi:4-hydroxyphenylpyruvate dioxygenase
VAEAGYGVRVDRNMDSFGSFDRSSRARLPSSIDVMRKSIASVAMSGSLPDRLSAIAAAGFDGVEIFGPNLDAFSGTAEDVRAHADGLGLAILLYQPLRDFEGVTDAKHLANLSRAEMAFDAMEALGAPLLLVCSNTEPDAIDDEARAADQLATLADRASRRNLRVGFEALAWGTRVKTFDHAWRIVRRANHPALGLILDSFHTLVRPEDWSALRSLPGERIAFVQVGDAPRMSADPLTIRRNHSRLPGHGELGVPSFVREVLATGYSGPLSIEIFNEKTPESPYVTARAAFASLVEVEKAARRLQ